MASGTAIAPLSVLTLHAAEIASIASQRKAQAIGIGT
jgi:hypothetical protein